MEVGCLAIHLMRHLAAVEHGEAAHTKSQRCARGTCRACGTLARKLVVAALVAVRSSFVERARQKATELLDDLLGPLGGTTTTTCVGLSHNLEVDRARLKGGRGPSAYLGFSTCGSSALTGIDEGSEPCSRLRGGSVKAAASGCRTAMADCRATPLRVVASRTCMRPFGDEGGGASDVWSYQHRRWCLGFESHGICHGNLQMGVSRELALKGHQLKSVLHSSPFTALSPFAVFWRKVHLTKASMLGDQSSIRCWLWWYPNRGWRHLRRRQCCQRKSSQAVGR
jgi:hypothetical protein